MMLIFQIGSGILLAAVVIFIVRLYLEHLVEKERRSEGERFHNDLRLAREVEEREIENRAALREERTAAWLAYYKEHPEEEALAHEFGAVLGKEIAIPLDGRWPPNALR
jgi:hypothetical protein